MLKILIFLAVFFSVNFAYSHSNQDSIIKIKFLLKPQEHVALFYNNEDILSFENKSINDTIICKEMLSLKSMEFRYGMITGQNTFIHKFYLSPNDTILLKVKDKFDIELVNKKAKNAFIDSWLDIRPIKMPSVQDIDGLSNYFKKIEKKYIKSSAEIDSLFNQGVIETETTKNWKHAIEIEYYRSITSVISKQNISKLPIKYKTIADNLINEIKRLNNFKSPDAEVLVYYITKYNLIKNSKDADNILNRINFLIKNQKVLGEDLMIQEALSNLKSFSSKSSTEYKLAYHRLEEFFKQNSIDNLAELEKFKYNNFTEMLNVKLVEVLGKRTSLDQIIDDKDQIIFIDLWASWCVPCRLQTPHLEKIKLKLKDKPIRFLSLSTDGDEGSAHWIQALKEDKLFGQLDQYRLLNVKDSPIMKFFNVKRIPRYIVLNKTGKVLNENFISPDDPDFEIKLMEMVKAE